MKQSKGPPDEKLTAKTTNKWIADALFSVDNRI